eukprot:1157652-Pelagomonas_calceolata.AAC.7
MVYETEHGTSSCSSSPGALVDSILGATWSSLPPDPEQSFYLLGSVVEFKLVSNQNTKFAPLHHLLSAAP